MTRASRALAFLLLVLVAMPPRSSRAGRGAALRHHARVQTGQFFTGPVEPRVPEDPARHLDALGRLRHVRDVMRRFGTNPRNGLLRDDYTEKPAFAGYAGLVRALGRVEPLPPATGERPAAPGPRPRARLTVGCRRARVTGRGIRSVTFRVRGRRTFDDRPPFVRAVRRFSRVRATVAFADGRRVTLTRRGRCR